MRRFVAFGPIAATGKLADDFDFVVSRLIVVVEDFLEAFGPEQARFCQGVIENRNFSTSRADRLDHCLGSLLPTTFVISSDVTDDFAIGCKATVVDREDGNPGCGCLFDCRSDGPRIVGGQHNRIDFLHDEVVDLIVLLVGIFIGTQHDHVVPMRLGLFFNGVADDDEKGIGQCHH